MTKSNDKKHRTDGTIPMKNTNMPTPLNSSNSPTSSYSDDLNKNSSIRNSKTNQLK